MDHTYFVSHGDCDGGPCYFTATTKDGTQLEFGRTPDSAPTSQPTSGPAWQWALNKVIDTRGNYIAIEYNSAWDHIRPVSIRYTGNDDAGMAGAPLRRVDFEYESRNDEEEYFVNGRRVRSYKRLKEIRTYVTARRMASTGAQPDRLVKWYRLTYDYSASSERSRLIRVLECGNDSGSCYGFGTDFLYQENDFTYGPGDYDHEEIGHLGVLGRRFYGDFNADGKTDIFTVHQPLPTARGTVEVTLSEINEGDPIIFEEPDADTSGGNGCLNCFFHRTYYFADFDGDGDDDMLTHKLPGRPDVVDNAEVMRSKGDGTFEPWFTFPSSSDVNGKMRYFIGDFNGDGRADILVSPNGHALKGELETHGWSGAALVGFEGFKLYLANDTGFSMVRAGPFPGVGERIHLGDFNGDSRADVLVTADREIYKYVYGASISGSQVDFSSGWLPHIWSGHKIYHSIGHDLVKVHEASNTWGFFDRLTPGDYNGDGQTDILVTFGGDQHLSNAYTGYVLARSMGSEFDSSISGSGPSVGPTAPITGDFNGDRRTDVFLPGIAYVSTGKGFKPFSHPGFGQTIETGDFNGDGMSDLRLFQSNLVPDCGGCIQPDDEHFRILSKGLLPDMLAEVRDSIGGRVLVEYKPMTDKDVYEATLSNPWPRTYITTSGYVVSQYALGEYIRTDTEILFTTPQRHSFKYFNAAFEAGLGWIGFSTIDRTDLSLLDEGQATRTRTVMYNFPVLAGDIERIETYTDPGGELIAERINEYYQADNLQGRLYRPVRAEVTNQYEGGSLAQSTRTEYVYDPYGSVALLADLGGPGPEDDFYVHTQYHNDAFQGRYGYPTDSKVTRDREGDDVVAHKVISYDAAMNVTYEGNWDDQNNVFLGATSRFDVWGNAYEIIDPDNHKTEIEYDAYGFISRTKNALNHVSEVVVDERFGLETTTTDANGQVSRSILDPLGRVIELHGPDANGNPTVLAKYSLTRAGLTPGFIEQTFLLEDWGANTYRWSERWKDALGRQTKTREKGINFKAIVVERALDPVGRVTGQTLKHFEGDTPQWVHRAYDIFHRPTVTTFPLTGVRHQLEYLDATQRILETSPRNELSEYELDARGRVIGRTKDGVKTTFRYDAAGHLVRIEDPASGSTTDIQYDSLGRRTFVEDSNIGTRSFEYDATGHLITERDSNGNAITRTYDALDRTLTKTVASPDQTTTSIFSYDTSSYGVGRLARVATQRYDLGGNPVGASSTYDYEYDRYGREAVTRFMIDQETYSFARRFGPQGSILALTYPDGSELLSGYATNGLLDELSLADAVVGAQATPYVRYSNFTAGGHAQNVQFKNGVATSYGYYAASEPGGHGLGEALRTVETQRSGTTLQDFEYTWTAGGPNVDEIFDHLNPGYTQKFHYDPAGRLESVQASYGSRSFAYHQTGAYQGNNISIMSAGSLSFHRSYTAQKLTDETYDDGANLLTATYGYDANGNMISKQKEGVLSTYTYDGEDQLLKVEQNNTLVGEFEYDHAGNRIKKTDAQGVVTLYVGSAYEVTRYPGAPGLELHTKYIEGPSGKLVAITHDSAAIGNLITQNTTNLSAAPLLALLSGWLSGSISAEVANSLLGAAALTLIAVFLLLFARQLHRPSTDYMRQHLCLRWAAPFVFSGFVSVFGLAGCGGPAELATGAAALVTPGAHGAGQPESGTLYFHHSHVNSATLVTGAGGQQVAKLEYEPFGKINHARSTGTDNFRPKFGGKEYDSDSELYYFGDRYYDPDIQRFLTPDRTIGAHPMHHAAFHRYAYANNNPVSFADPSGQFAVEGFLIGVAIAATIGALVAGTNGLIFSDPGNAFKNFNWEAAAVGAFVGAAIGTFNYGLGAIGSAGVGGATLYGKPIGEYLQKSFNSAVLNTVQAWSKGVRDANRLGAYFGASFMGGLISTTGFFWPRKGQGRGGGHRQALRAGRDLLYELPDEEGAGPVRRF